MMWLSITSLTHSASCPESPWNWHTPTGSLRFLQWPSYLRPVRFYSIRLYLYFPSLIYVCISFPVCYDRSENNVRCIHCPFLSGVVNLGRVEVLWRPVTNHLLDVCQHPHVRMREWGVEAVTYLVKAALTHKHNPPLKDNQVNCPPYLAHNVIKDLLITRLFVDRGA